MLRRVIGQLLFNNRKKQNNYPKTTTISHNVKIYGSFSCGENCKIVDSVRLFGKVTIGRYTSINGPNVDIIARVNEVKIGSFCSIATGVVIQEFNHNFKLLTSYFIHQNLFKDRLPIERVSKGPIIVGNDVWIGAHSIILSGVTIGNGAVVAANSVVTKDVPPYAIVAGSPARVINYRFKTKTIEEFLRLKWWDWSIEKIRENKELFLKEYE